MVVLCLTCMVNKGYKNKQIIEEDQSKSSNKKRTMIDTRYEQ